MPFSIRKIPDHEVIEVSMPRPYQPCDHLILRDTSAGRTTRPFVRRSSTPESSRQRPRRSSGHWCDRICPTALAVLRMLHASASRRGPQVAAVSGAIAAAFAMSHCVTHTTGSPAGPASGPAGQPSQTVVECDSCGLCTGTRRPGDAANSDPHGSSAHCHAFPCLDAHSHANGFPLEPTFDPLRKNPRFQRLVASGK